MKTFHRNIHKNILHINFCKLKGPKAKVKGKSDFSLYVVGKERDAPLLFSGNKTGLRFGSCFELSHSPGNCILLFKATLRNNSPNRWHTHEP